MIFLSSPYTAPEGPDKKAIEEERYQSVVRWAGRLLAKRNKVWSPIVHNHVLAQLYDLPTDHRFWKDVNFDVIRRCDELWIACMDGWDKSEGVLEEGGIGGEGTHHIVRGNGPSQYAYLTSSVVDLDPFVGKKVQVWGETMSGKKAGWLINQRV